MKRLPTRPILALLALLLTALPLWADGTSWESKLAERWRILHISNGYTEVAIAPDLGGRLVMLRLAASPGNLLRLARPAILRLGPDELSPYRLGWPYGGLREPPRYGFALTVPTVTVPANPVALVAETTVAGVHLRRVVTPLPETTTVRLETTLTNRLPQFLDLAPGFTGDFAFPPGSPMVQSAADAAQPWIAVADAAGERAMLVRLTEGIARIEAKPMRSDELAGAPLLADGPGFLRLDLIGVAQETAAEASCRLVAEASLYRGLTAIDLVHETALLQVTTDHAAYYPGEPVIVRVAAARPGKGAPFTAKVTLDGQEKELAFTCPQAGLAQSLPWNLEAGLPTDGTYAGTVEVFGQRLSFTVTVASEQLNALATRRRQLDQRIVELANRGALAKYTEAIMARARYRELEEAAGRRDQARTAALLEALEKDVERWLDEAR